MVINTNTGKVLVSELRKANTFLTRFMGLLPDKQIKSDQGLLLTPCNGVHTMLMRFTIDVLYLDESMRVIKTFSGVKPWRVLPISKQGKHVLEVAPGTIESTQTLEGHILQIQMS